MPPEERAQWLGQASAGDDALRAEVERLLRAHESTGEFLERPVLDDPDATRATNSSTASTGIERIAHFRILEKLGEGGMGTVYKAEDTRLGRTVAIKLLSGRLVRQEEARARFLREAQAASALDHPNICTVYEVEETEAGRLAIVMAYYDGQTLRQRLAHGQMSPREAVQAAAQAAHGLVAAHEAGIVHRDIKPANLMMTRDGAIKILDFGIAKIGSGDNLTIEGANLGTVNYMAPEQARGDQIDHRVDIWALGVVLYELIAGVNPFRRENHLATINAILYEDPEPLRPTERGINCWPVLLHALQKDPDQRYQTMREFSAALDTLKDTSDSAATLETFRQLRPAPSVAVLPFKNLSPGEDSGYFSEGLTEDLAHELSRVPGLRLVSRSAAHQFSSEADPRDAGRRLNVATVVEGTVRKSGARVRITAQLINVADGYHLWSGRFDREVGDILEVQDEISRSIAGQLVEQLQPPDTRRSAPRNPVHPEAYEWYMRGRFHLNQWTPASVARAAECFERTIALDAGLAPAWLGLSRSHLQQSILGFGEPRQHLPRALEAANHAVALAPHKAEMLAVAAVALGLLHWDWHPARQTLTGAYAKEPNDPLVQAWYCEIVLLPQKRFDEALSVTAPQCDGESLLQPPRMGAAWLPLWSREPERTIEIADRCISLSPAVLAPYWIKSIAWENLGQLPRAIECLRGALQLDPESTLTQGLLARLLAVSGQRAEAVEAVGFLESLRARRYVAPTHLTWPSIALGDFDRAFVLLEEAIERRDYLALYLDSYPVYEPLRSDPRFPALLARTLDVRGAGRKA